YARFQTVMMDAHSINVTYDRNRGEPRRNGTEKIGDCIACNMCVVVCPTGIDIRDGVQIGCIACGKCVDACTKIMGKEKKKTLIGYLTENQVSAKTKEIKWIRPRTVVYGTLLSVVLVTAITLLSFRIPLYMSILPDRNVQPMSIPGNIVRNFYKMKVQNLSLQEQNLNIEVLPGKDSDKFKVLTGEETTLSLSKTERKEIRIMESGLRFY
ncbi:MAG: 4Fe-4S dicluster domain-containing protein, partial [Leptospira sp.]|nr:4Fe-4S dicluster domain-containing protein [Leptospira sp.]